MQKLLSSVEAADYLGIQPGTLAKWRCYHSDNMPPYVKCGRSIKYRLEDLEEFVNQNLVSSNGAA